MSYLPTIIAAIAAVVPFLAQPLSDLISAHPQASALIYGLLAIVNHLIPAPASSPIAK